jgi:hypothetical protein
MSESEPKGSDPKVIEKNGDSFPTYTTHTSSRPWWKLGGKDISFATVDPASASVSLHSDIENSSGDETNIKGTVFDDHAAAEFYRPVEKYEGRHRFDPTATWTPEEERKLLRTVTPPTEAPDCFIVLTQSLM